ncbi:MAG: hypothetical protein M1829_006894 [Trizodia sp. TS-e1964]|nr:MAG: hypothetical protein M1829_006894 [Trizodia sp. TS-e1964]
MHPSKAKDKRPSSPSESSNDNVGNKRIKIEPLTQEALSLPVTSSDTETIGSSFPVVPLQVSTEPVASSRSQIGSNFPSKPVKPTKADKRPQPQPRQRFHPDHPFNLRRGVLWESVKDDYKNTLYVATRRPAPVLPSTPKPVVRAPTASVIPSPFVATSRHRMPFESESPQKSQPQSNSPADDNEIVLDTESPPFGASKIIPTKLMLQSTELPEDHPLRNELKLVLEMKKNRKIHWHSLIASIGEPNNPADPLYGRFQREEEIADRRIAEINREIKRVEARDVLTSHEIFEPRYHDEMVGSLKVRSATNSSSHLSGANATPIFTRAAGKKNGIAANNPKTSFSQNNSQLRRNRYTSSRNHSHLPQARDNQATTPLWTEKAKDSFNNEWMSEMGFGGANVSTISNQTSIGTITGTGTEPEPEAITGTGESIIDLQPGLDKPVSRGVTSQTAAPEMLLDHTTVLQAETAEPQAIVPLGSPVIITSVQDEQSLIIAESVSPKALSMPTSSVPLRSYIDLDAPVNSAILDQFNSREAGIYDDVPN